MAAVALALFDSAVPDTDPETRRELAWACALHEVGLMVSHHDHHRHSAYLLANVDAPGFSQSQQRRIGDLVLGQRGGLRKVEPQLASETFAWQVLCLRLAVIKCHARGEADPQGAEPARPRPRRRAGPRRGLGRGQPAHLVPAAGRGRHLGTQRAAAAVLAWSRRTSLPVATSRHRARTTACSTTRAARLQLASARTQPPHASLAHRPGLRLARQQVGGGQAQRGLVADHQHGLAGVGPAHGVQQRRRRRRRAPARARS